MSEPRARKVRLARRIVLAPDMTAPAALAAAAEEGLRQLVANEASARLGIDVEGVHQMRVGLRRLKVALSLANKLDLAPERDALKAELDWIGDVLGRARDLDVFIADTLEPLRARHAKEASLARLHRVARAAREAAYAALRETLDSPRYAAARQRLGAWIAVLESATGSAPRQPSLGEIAVALLDKRDRRLRRFALKRGWHSKAELHALRLHAKKLRYTAAFFASLFPRKSTKAFIAAVSELQDVLGLAHDSEVARHVLAALGTRPAPDAPPRGTWRRADALVEGWHLVKSADVAQRIEPAWLAVKNAKRFW